jgi:hypothetical protein
MAFGPDVQLIANPGHDRAREPVAVVEARG